MAFRAIAATAAKCVLRDETRDSEGDPVITLKVAQPGLRDDLELARGMPVIVAIRSAHNRADSTMHRRIACACQTHRTGLVAGADCVIQGCAKAGTAGTSGIYASATSAQYYDNTSC